MRVSLPRFRSVRRRWLIGGTVLVVAIAVGGWWFQRDSSSAAQVSVATVSKGDYETTVSATGTISPKRSEDLSFAAAGEVTAVRVAVGDTVHKGEVLAELDTSLLRAERSAAQSSVDAALTQLDEDSDGGASDTQLAADSASLAAARSQLASATASVADGTLRAGFAGLVSAVNVAVGDQAGSSSGSSSGTDAASSTATASTADLTVISRRSYVVDATVGSSDLAGLTKGLQVEITPTGATDMVYGTLAEIGTIASADSSGAASFPITIDVTGTPKGLYAGSSADVSVVVKKVTDVLTVPSQALHTDGDSTFVYVVAGDSRRRTEVKLGTAYGMQTQVRSGLSEGDRVEVEGFSAPGGGGTPQQGELPGGFPEGGFPQGGPPAGGAQ